MVGTVAKTKYLLVRYDHVKGTFDTLGDVCRHLGVTINNLGEIKFMGEPVLPHYGLKKKSDIFNSDGYTREEAVNDWARYYMRKYLPSEYQVYRYLL
jgi:hypothetical protein